MNQFNCSYAKAAAAALVAVIGFTLAPTLIDPTASRSSDSHDVSTRSWVADAFPTGQATFARPVARGGDQ